MKRRAAELEFKRSTALQLMDQPAEALKAIHRAKAHLQVGPITFSAPLVDIVMQNCWSWHVCCASTIFEPVRLQTCWRISSSALYSLDSTALHSAFCLWPNSRNVCAAVQGIKVQPVQIMIVFALEYLAAVCVA